MENSNSNKQKKIPENRIPRHRGTLAAGVVAPVVGMAIHPWLKETVYGLEDFINIGKLDDFPVGIPKK